MNSIVLLRYIIATISAFSIGFLAFCAWHSWHPPVGSYWYNEVKGGASRFPSLWLWINNMLMMSLVTVRFFLLAHDGSTVKLGFEGFLLLTTLSVLSWSILISRQWFSKRD